MTVVLNDNNELIPSRTVTGWKVCIDYRKLNDATRKDHFPLPFIDQMLERLCGNEYYCFLDGFSRFFQIPIAPEDQVKTTFTGPYGTFAYRRIPFGLCNAPATFQRCMTAIFHDMVEDFMEVFMDDFLVFEGIVLGHKISRAGIEVDRAKIDGIAKLPYPTNILMKDAKFDFSDDCKKEFNILKEKLTITPIIISPDWNVPFELMYDSSDFVVGAVLGQRIDGKFKPIYYFSKTLNNAQEHYTTTEKELLAIVFSFDKFRKYLILSKTVVYTDHSALKYLFSKEDTKPRLIRTFTEEEITDEFLDEHLMILKTKLNNDEPWYADYDEPYAFKLCSDNVMRRCIAGNEILKILAHYHSGPTGGHHSASITRKKVYESRFYWPSIFKDAKDYMIRCDACQRSGNISSRSEMPQNNIQESKYENPSNTTTDSFFKAYEVRDNEKQSQTKRKYSNTSNSINELPNKRRCKAEKFKAIQYSLGLNEEYIAIKSYEYDIWERNEDNMSKIYQDIFQKRDEGWKVTRTK
ncbi:reverse transcriptase domain-containing protein [Tanacetum coccineum]